MRFGIRVQRRNVNHDPKCREIAQAVAMEVRAVSGAGGDAEAQMSAARDAFVRLATECAPTAETALTMALLEEVDEKDVERFVVTVP